MNRLTPCVSFILLIMSGCTFDLTEVRIEARDPRMAVTIETTRGSDTRVTIHIDPGITERGVARTLVHESVDVDNVAYPPTERLEEWRLYDVMVPEAAPSIGIVLPSITGMAEIPAFAAVPLRVVAADTVTDNAGILEIPVLGTEDIDASSHWNAMLYAAGATVPQLSVRGTHSIPSVLRIPTIHLSPEVQAGHVEVSGASLLTVLGESTLHITLQRIMRASVPFRIAN